MDGLCRDCNLDERFEHLYISMLSVKNNVGQNGAFTAKENWARYIQPRAMIFPLSKKFTNSSHPTCMRVLVQLGEWWIDPMI